MIELKSCPFCGGEAIERMWLPEGCGSGQVGCLTSDCAMEDAEIPIADWNRRAQVEPLTVPPPKITKEQAIVLMAMTGASICPLSWLVDDFLMRTGREAWSLDMGNKACWAEIKESYRADFAKLFPYFSDDAAPTIPAKPVTKEQK